MEVNNFTLLFRYQGHVAVKISHPNLQYGALIDFVRRKWNFMEGRSLRFTYHIQQLGDCYLTEDDDIPAMFILLRRYGLQQIDVQVGIQDVSGRFTQDCNIANTDPYTDTNAGSSDNHLLGRVENINPLILVAHSKTRLSAAWSKLIEYEGQVFHGGAEEFRKSLIKYSVEVGFDFKYLKNETSRVTAECKFKRAAGCNWRVHATGGRTTKELSIKKLNNVHSCSTRFGSAGRKKFTSKVIIDLIADDIRNMPGITPRDVQRQVKDKFGVDISYYVAWKSTEGGRARIFGDHSDSYSTLAAYLAELERSNPASTVDLDIHPIKNNFRRCFFAFGACITGFKYCSPVVMIDGTFMRGRHKGILLSAVGKDGNEGIPVFEFYMNSLFIQIH